MVEKKRAKGERKKPIMRRTGREKNDRKKKEKKKGTMARRVEKIERDALKMRDKEYHPNNSMADSHA